MRGDTAAGGATKQATLETGLVRVPLFIKEGEIVRVSNQTGDVAVELEDVSILPSRNSELG